MLLLKIKNTTIALITAILAFPSQSQAYEDKTHPYADNMTKIIITQMRQKYSFDLNGSGHSNSNAIEGFTFSFNSQSFLELDQARQFILQVRSDIEWIVNKNTGLPKMYFQNYPLLSKDLTIHIHFIQKKTGLHPTYPYIGAVSIGNNKIGYDYYDYSIPDYKPYLMETVEEARKKILETNPSQS